MTFYKKLFAYDSKKNIKEWLIEVKGGSYFVTFGKQDGKMQTKETVCKGKNTGKANETTDEQQALLEAQSKFRSQLDKGYRESLEELNHLPLLPILCQKFEESKHKLSDDVFISRKLDGVRCLIEFMKGKWVLLSKKRKPYIVPHIEHEINIALAGTDTRTVYDGELYVHGFKLQQIRSAVTRVDAKEVYEKTGLDEDKLIYDIRNNIKFYLFDIIKKDEFNNVVLFRKSLDEYNNFQIYKNCKFVEDKLCYLGNLLGKKSEVRHYTERFMKEGYEGSIARDYNLVYESGVRSPMIQKDKLFKDKEFKVLGVREDKNGNAVLLMDNGDGQTFETTVGDFNERKEQLNNPQKYIGRWLNVQYQSTLSSGLPEFPTGKYFREMDSSGNPED